MKIAFNPSTVAALTSPPNNKDITFDLTGRNIYARGVKFFGTDTWRPVVDNLTSSATDQSLSANMGRYLKSLIDGKAATNHNHDSVYSKLDHNHDGRYVRQYNYSVATDCDNLLDGLSQIAYSATNAAVVNHSAFLYITGVGTPFQLQIPDSSNSYIFKRHKYNGTWSSWYRLNAGGADQLTTARNINGTSFNGTADITTSIWGTTRNITIGSTTKAVNGSTNVSWSLSEIGAAAASHNHTSLTGVTRINFNADSSDSCYIGTTVSAPSTTLDFYLSDDAGQESFRWIFGDCNSAVGTKTIMQLIPTNNANTALKLYDSYVATQSWVTSQIPTALKNPYSLTIFGVSYDGSSAKTVDKTTFISTLEEATATITDGTMLITSWASNNGFADSGGVNVPYKRKAIHLWGYINSKTNSLYVTSLGTQNMQLSWTKNGSTNYITIPGTADNGVHAETASGTTANATNEGMLFGSGMYMTRTYNNSGMPCAFGNVLNMAGGGSSQLLLGWSGSDSTTAYIYYRSHRDTTSGGWGAWRRLFYADELPSSMKNPNAIKFRDINGTTISYDGSSAVDLTAGTYIAKLPYGFNSWSSGCTWGNTTGTSFASWNDSTGGAIDFRRDNPSSGKMSIKVDGRVYVNEGSNPVLSSELGNGFWGMRTPDGGNNWIRTPDNGLIPYASGSAGSGHSSLGTSTWYFSTAYIDKVYGSLYGNASNIYFQNDATLTLYAITSGQNSAYGTETVGIQSCFDNQNPVTSTYPSTYTNRCQIALQPRGGRVAIGTTNADYTLHVAGDVYSTSKVIAPKFQVGSYGYIYTGSDLSPTVGGNLANVVISSWYGVSFTSNCCGDYVNTTSVGIDTRYGIIRAAKYEGNWYNYAYDLYTANTTDTWVPVMHSGKLQHRVIPVAYNNAPSTLDVNSATYAYHLRINSANTWSNWYWSGQSGQPTWLWGSNDGTNMYVWSPSNFSVAQAKRTYNSVTGTNAVELVRGDMADNDQFRILVGGTASNAGYAEIATADDGTEPIYVRQYTGVFTTVKRTLTLLSAEGYSYFPSYINIGGNEGNNSSPNRVWGSNGSDTFLRSYLTSALSVNYATSAGNADTVDGYHAASLLPTNYYWANIKISASSNTQTQPSVNTIYANNWYRSTGNSGWYSETYGGGWYMQDTTWIRTWGSKSVYCDQMIYSSNSIRMSNIYLQYSNEINCTSTLYLQHDSSNKLSLCYGGGQVAIGPTYTLATTTSYPYKLLVEGSTYSQGFRHASVNSDNYVLLAGGGYSQGVPVKYYAAYTLNVGTSATNYARKAGNWYFITQTRRIQNGTISVLCSFPSGYDTYSTFIWGQGRSNTATSNSAYSNIYVTVVHTSGNYIYINLADDASLNNGSCMLYFMCF